MEGVLETRIIFHSNMHVVTHTYKKISRAQNKTREYIKHVFQKKNNESPAEAVRIVDILTCVLLVHVRVYVRGKTHTIERMGSGFDVTGSINGSFGFAFSVRKMFNTYMQATSFFFNF